MIDFQKVEASARALKQQAAAGNIDSLTLEAQLKEMIDLAEDGYYWMFGHLTEQWYRHDGQHWVPDDPTTIKARLHTPADQEPLAAEFNPSEIWRSLDPGWFFISLVTLGVLFGVIYTASL